ncbi:MAG: HD domain-containing protein [Candidatus Gastranaerophilales bacterium]|nr:HD domain-containing protein [Candidatus Gastranaerophilales bacterium]
MNFDFNDFNKAAIDNVISLLNKKSELYLVGGFLRDKILGKETLDLDFVVKGQDAIELARDFADKTNGYFILLDNEHEIARVVAEDKFHYFDFARCENDDIEHDLKRRDLTINAICMELYPENKIIDKFNGIEDLKNKQIKIISEKNLTDDPLRILRVFRFASLLNFDIEQNTFELAQKHHKLIHNVAEERILTELLKLFEGENSAKTIKMMKETGLLYELFDLLEKEVKIPPNTHHHLPLIDHSIETVHQVEIKIQEAPDFVKEKLNSYQTNGVKYLSLLKLACLLHDVGKPTTWTIEENGRHRFINHDAVGAELLKPDLKKMKFSKAQIKYITTLVRNHIYPSQLARENEEANEKPVHRMFRKLEDCTIDVLLLAMADRLSAQGEAVTKEMTKNNLKALTKYLYMYKDFCETSKPLPKLLDGNEISEILNIKKGIRLGEIIKELNNAQLSGEVNTKEEAIIYIKSIKE